MHRPLLDPFTLGRRVIAWQHRRRWSVPVFTARMAGQHPELGRQVRWADARRIAEREGILIQSVPLSADARLLRIGQLPVLQVRRGLGEKARTVAVMHELAHFWRDDPGEAAYYSDEGDRRQDPREEFADIFAWYVTSPHRPQLSRS